MAIDRLKSGLWVQAQIRICGINNIPIYVLRKGDEDAGAIIMKLDRMDGTCRIYNQVRGLNDEISWATAGAGERMMEADANAYLERQKSFDPDIWIIEIEDADDRYQLDGQVL
ncbi:MAG: DUF1491 family protein [Rhodospirillales bacterium]|nr:DUF1491 family protein [Rhodospirillales bacterium]